LLSDKKGKKRITGVEVCDARDDDSSTTDGEIKSLPEKAKNAELKNYKPQTMNYKL
jgi:hypothetical protein